MKLQKKPWIAKQALLAGADALASNNVWGEMWKKLFMGGMVYPSAQPRLNNLNLKNTNIMSWTI